MSKKNSATTIIIAIINLLTLGYLLFFTVYRQMISQNEGFFYVVVFGGILVLVYILLSLMTKLLAFSTDSDGNNVFIILEVIFIIVMSVLFVKARISYTTSIPAEESIVYRTAELIELGDLSIGGMDIFPQLLSNPGTYIMGYFLAFIFKFSGADTSIIIYINTGLLLATALMVFAITRRLSSRICSLLAYVTCLFMPAFDFSVYSFNHQLFYAFILSTALLFSVIIITQSKSNSSTIISMICSGIFWGLSFAIEPSGILILLFIILFTKNKLFSKMSLFIALIAVAFFLGLGFLKSITLDLSFGEIMTGFFQSMNPFISEYGDSLDFSEILEAFNNKLDSQQKAINDNYYFLSTMDGSPYPAVKVAWMQLGNQILYMFVIILSIACSFYMIRSKNSRAVPVMSSIFAAIFMIFLGSQKEYNILFFILLIIIAGSVSLQYMYENHHALADESFQEMLADEEEEQVQKEEEEIDSETFMLRSQALIFIGANESYYHQIKDEEKQKEIERKLYDDKSDKPASSEASEAFETIESFENNEEIDNVEVFETLDSYEDNAEPVELLETPLPMPPKHVAKVLDYDIAQTDTDNDDFDFDFDIDDENFKDFDED